MSALRLPINKYLRAQRACHTWMIARQVAISSSHKSGYGVAPREERSVARTVGKSGISPPRRNRKQRLRETISRTPKGTKEGRKQKRRRRRVVPYIRNTSYGVDREVGATPPYDCSAPFIREGRQRESRTSGGCSNDDDDAPLMNCAGLT